MVAWLEKRRERRQKRYRFETWVARVLVPVIVFLGVWVSLQAIDALKGTPIMTILTGKDASRAAP